MIPFQKVREICLAFEAAEEAPHFEITSFRVKKKIFLTLNFDRRHVTVRLSEMDQSIFCGYDANIIFPVPNKWGKSGWTHINLELVDEELLKEAIRLSYCLIAPKKLAAKYQLEAGE
jgi:predicted DNA-binding protein (MmcQ/YjbR family)